MNLEDCHDFGLFILQFFQRQTINIDTVRCILTTNYIKLIEHIIFAPPNLCME